MNAPLRLPFFDTLMNLVSGLGTTKDKTYHAQYIVTQLTRESLDAMFRADWIARKIVTAPAQDATREWRAWKAEADQIEAIEELEQRFSTQNKVYRALVRARLYGEAYIVLGVKQGDASTELNVDRVGKDDLQFIHVVTNDEMQGVEENTDLLSPYYREPRYYQRTPPNGTPVQIHPSRVIRFIGAELPNDLLTVNGMRGDSVLQAVEDAIRAAGIVNGGIAALVQEARNIIIKIPELSARLTTQEYSNQLQTRLTLANQLKSLINATVIDSEEDWEQMQPSFASMPDLMKMYLLIAAGAADIPATRLLGQSPAGLNATGESDVRNYYDRIKGDQINTLTPQLTRLDEVQIRSATGARDENIHYIWNPLWQLTDVEKADLAQKKAATFQVDLNSGLFSPGVMREARANQLVEDGTYPGLELALEEDEEIPLEEQNELALEQQRMALIAGPQKKSNGGPRDADRDGRTREGKRAWDAYNPDQPRDPEGTPTGGQWTSGGSAHGDTPEEAEQFATERLITDGPREGSSRVGVVRGRNLGYWGGGHSGSQAITGHSAQVMGIEGYRDMGPDAALRAVGDTLLDAIAADERGSGEMLYHGFDNSEGIEWRDGDTLRLPLTATSGSLQDSAGYGIKYTRSDEGNAGATVFEFPVGTRKAGYSRWDRVNTRDFGHTWAEAIVAGEFRVKGRRTEREPGWRGLPVTVVSLEPVSVYDRRGDRWRKI